VGGRRHIQDSDFFLKINDNLNLVSKWIVVFATPFSSPYGPLYSYIETNPSECVVLYALSLQY
jgi:hypothetical protein